MRKLVYGLMFVLGCGEDLPPCAFSVYSAPLSDGQKVRSFLDAHPIIDRSLIWVNSEFPNGCLASGDPIFSKIIQDHIEKFRQGQAALSYAPQGIGFDSENSLDSRGMKYREDTALRMWWEHVAISLWQEIDIRLPWSVKEFTGEELALLFDSREFISFLDADVYGDVYAFRASPHGGRIGVTDWSAFVSYKFLLSHDLVSTDQHETVMHLIDWMRAHLVQEIGRPTELVYLGRCQYHGFPTAECLVQEYTELHEYHCAPQDKNSCDPKDYLDYYGRLQNPIADSHTVVSLFAALLHSVNIPVRRGFTRLPDGDHSRPEFPTLGTGLLDADDVYNEYFRPGLWNSLEAELLFLELEEIALLAEAEELDHSHNDDDVRMITRRNLAERNTMLAFEHYADVLLIERSLELEFLIQPGTLRRRHMDRENCDGENIFGEPLIRESWQTDFTRRIDNQIWRIGSGSLYRGVAEILERADWRRRANYLNDCYPFR